MTIKAMSKATHRFHTGAARRSHRIARQYRLGPLFTPPSEIKDGGTKGTCTNPGGTGGSLWQSGAFDPESNIFYILEGRPGITSVRNDRNRISILRGPGADLSVRGLPT